MAKLTLFDGEVELVYDKASGTVHRETNADRIRRMTDEELAQWYWWMLKYVQGYTDSRCALLDWLRKEADTCNNSEETCAAKLE